MDIRLISRGPNKGQLGIYYNYVGKNGNRISAVELAPNTPAGRKKLENFIKNRPKPGQGTLIKFTDAELEKIKKLKLKGLTEEQIVAQANIPKLKSTAPLQRLNLPSREDIVFKPREDKVKELARTGKYTRAQILAEIQKLFGVQMRNERLDPLLKGFKIPSGLGTHAGEQSAKKSLYLKDYTFENLEKDIKAGKLQREIGKEIYNKNPTYFDKLPVQKDSVGRARNIITTITTAINDRIRKRPELGKLDELNVKKFNRLQKVAIDDIRNFIKQNTEAYKKVYASNKVGAVDKFKEKILDYASQKYPKFVERSAGDVTGKILNNQRIFTPYEILGRNVTMQGEYGRDLALRKDIKKALGISERPLKGEGKVRDRLTRRYNKDIVTNLKAAQAKGLVPKIDPITGNPINSEPAYYRYVNRTQIDPIRNLFGKKYKFGQEHVGGIARATIANDPKVLTQITAMDPYQNKFVKGSNYDTKITNLMKLAKQSSPEKAKDYLAKAKQLIEEADIKFGLESPTPKLVGEEIINIHPKSSLEDSILKKAQRAIKSFIATGRDKEPAFKQIDPFLQNAIKMVKKVGTFNPASNQLLTKALRRTGVAGLVAVLGIGMLGGEAEAGEVTQSKVVEPQETLKYNSTLGSIVNTKTEEPANQLQVWEWLKDNPVKTVAGTSIGFSTQEIPGAYKKARE